MIDHTFNFNIKIFLQIFEYEWTQNKVQLFASNLELLKIKLTAFETK
jgi:hypothetical protein